MRAPIYVHVLLFHRQQRQQPITKEVLRQSKWPRHISIMDRLVVLPIDAPTCVSYRPQPKATRIWHELQSTRSATTMDKRVTLLMSVPINNTARSTLLCLLSGSNSNKGPIQPKNKAMQLCNSRWSSPRAIFRLLLLGTRTCRCCRPVQTPRRIQLSGDVSITEKRTTMLMCAPNCDHTLIGCQQPTHLPIEVSTLFSWLLGRTLLEEESTKWVLKNLRMP
jgi:hypothetical protein